jgi:antitoxin component of MazEF toxin-antitoxin module
MNSRKSKAVRLGNATAVVLPVDWVRGHQVEQGDLLDVRYDGVITVRAQKKQGKDNLE